MSPPAPARPTSPSLGLTRNDGNGKESEPSPGPTPRLTPHRSTDAHHFLALRRRRRRHHARRRDHRDHHRAPAGRGRGFGGGVVVSAAPGPVPTDGGTASSSSPTTAAPVLAGPRRVAVNTKTQSALRHRVGNSRGLDGRERVEQRGVVRSRRRPTEHPADGEGRRQTARPRPARTLPSRSIMRDFLHIHPRLRHVI